MEQLLKWMEIIEDDRQRSKVRHSLKDILAIVLLATLAHADTWEQMEDFAKNHEEYLRRYLELKHGIPSHDTIQRAMGMVRTEYLQQLQMKWQELLNSNEGEVIKKSSAWMGRPCVPISVGKEDPTISCQPGAGRMAAVWDKKQWKKKVMRLRPSRKFRTPLGSKGRS